MTRVSMGDMISGSFWRVLNSIFLQMMMQLRWPFQILFCSSHSDMIEPAVSCRIAALEGGAVPPPV